MSLTRNRYKTPKKQLSNKINSKTSNKQNLLKTHKVLKHNYQIIITIILWKQQKQPQQEANTQQTDNTQQQEAPKYKVSDIDWVTLNNMGISQEYLEKRNLLDPLLKGFKTNELVPVSFNLGGTVTRFDARLSLQQNNEGQVSLAVHGIRKEPQLKYPFFGHTFSEEDKKNLLTTGNMGRVVELTNTKTGEKIPSIISVDKLTNELIALRTDKIKVPDEIKGVQLSEEQKQTLKEGKPLFLEGMQSKKGEPFSANVQFNVDKTLRRIFVQ